MTEQEKILREGLEMIADCKWIGETIARETLAHADAVQTKNASMGGMADKIYIEPDDGERCTPYYAEKYGTAVAYIREDLVPKTPDTPTSGRVISEAINILENVQRPFHTKSELDPREEYTIAISRVKLALSILKGEQK